MTLSNIVVIRWQLCYDSHHEMTHFCWNYGELQQGDIYLTLRMYVSYTS